MPVTGAKMHLGGLSVGLRVIILSMAAHMESWYLAVSLEMSRSQIDTERVMQFFDVRSHMPARQKIWLQGFLNKLFALCIESMSFAPG